MGVIIRQSFWNMSTTYAGFALGAVNTLFLYTNFMSKEDTGLVLSLVSLSAILMPYIAVGMNNALIRFLPLEKDKDSLLSFTLAVPAFVFIVLGTVVYTKADWLKNFFEQGAVLADFVPLAFWIAVFSAFFEVFYGYAQAHMRSTEGVFLRELFYRISTTVLLFAVYLGWVNVTWFCYLLTASFALRLGIMMFVAYRCRPFRLEKFVFGKYRKVIAYGLFSSMGMAIWAALLEFDKTMLPFYEDLSMVASYAIASFIGMTVAVPYRSLYQIANPILAKAIADGDVARQKELSFKSSINSMILCGGLFLLINCNIEQIYNLLPKNYEAQALVVLLISLAKLFDAVSGLAGSFIVYSKYFRWDLFFSICLMVSVTGSNLYFIPRWGINGAAMATLISLIVINALRIGFVYSKTGHSPFRSSSLVTAVIIAVFYFAFSGWHIGLPFGAAGIVASIILKSALITTLFGFAILKLKISPELDSVFCSAVSKIFGRKEEKHR